MAASRLGPGEHSHERYMPTGFSAIYEVTFENKEDLQKVVDHLQKLDILGRVVGVNENDLSLFFKTHGMDYPKRDNPCGFLEAQSGPIFSADYFWKNNAKSVLYYKTGSLSLGREY